MRDAQGRRSAGRIRGRVVGFDAAARALSVEISQQVSTWQPNPTRTVTIPAGPRPVRGRELNPAVPQPDLTAAERAALAQFRAEIAQLPTWQLLEIVPMLAAAGTVTIRCLFAVLAAHLIDRLHLDQTMVLAHPDGPAAGILDEHRAAQLRTAQTN